MIIKNFKIYLEHLLNVFRCSQANQFLLLLDNHESHLDHQILKFAKNNDIVLLTLPLHCSHKLQPLDVSRYGPFKTYCNKSVDQWLLNNPGVLMNMFNIAEIVGMSFPSAFTPSNIIRGFERTLIAPFNREVLDGFFYVRISQIAL